MKSYTVKSPSLPENTLKSYKAKNKDQLEQKLRADGLDCYQII